LNGDSNGVSAECRVSFSSLTTSHPSEIVSCIADNFRRSSLKLSMERETISCYGNRSRNVA